MDFESFESFALGIKSSSDRGNKNHRVISDEFRVICHDFGVV